MKIEALGGMVAAALVVVAGCDVLHTMHSDHTGQHGTAPTPPTGTFAPLAWIDSASGAQLTAMLCPLLAADTPLSSDATAACRARGPAPTATAVAFSVRSEASITNGGMVRLAIQSALLVLTLYPDAGSAHALGAVCLTFCDAGASQCPQTDESCRSTNEGVVELGDLDGASGLASSIAADEHRLSDLTVRDLPAHGSASLTIDVALSRERLLAAIQRNDSEATAAIRAGQPATFRIPYALEGTIWVDGRGNDGFAEPLTRATGTLEIASE